MNKKKECWVCGKDDVTLYDLKGDGRQEELCYCDLIKTIQWLIDNDCECILNGAWYFSKVTDPWALKYGAKVQAVNDEHLKSAATVEELLNDGFDIYEDEEKTEED